MDSASARPNVLILCNDLFFTTQLRAAAESAGARADVELAAGKAASRIASGHYHVLAIDLELAGLDIADLISGLPSDNRPVVLAFGPHVQVGRLAAAKEAGCDHVVPRSQAAATLTKLL